MGRADYTEDKESKGHRFVFVKKHLTYLDEDALDTWGGDVEGEEGENYSRQAFRIGFELCGFLLECK